MISSTLRNMDKLFTENWKVSHFLAKMNENGISAINYIISLEYFLVILRRITKNLFLYNIFFGYCSAVQSYYQLSL